MYLLMSTLKALNAAVRAMTRQAGAPAGQDWCDAGLSVAQRQLVQAGTEEPGRAVSSFVSWLAFPAVRQDHGDLRSRHLCGPKDPSELGAGHGDIGAFFRQARRRGVLGLDGRAENVELARCKHLARSKACGFEQFNLENDFSQFGRFDLILDLGLLSPSPQATSMRTCGVASRPQATSSWSWWFAIPPILTKIFFFCPRGRKWIRRGPGGHPQPPLAVLYRTTGRRKWLRFFYSDILRLISTTPISSSTIGSTGTTSASARTSSCDASGA